MGKKNKEITGVKPKADADYVSRARGLTTTTETVHINIHDFLITTNKRHCSSQSDSVNHCYCSCEQGRQ